MKRELWCKKSGGLSSGLPMRRLVLLMVLALVVLSLSACGRRSGRSVSESEPFFPAEVTPTALAPVELDLETEEADTLTEKDELFDEEDVCDHEYTVTVTEASCLSGGCTTHTCALCGYSYTDGETQPLGHDYVLSDDGEEYVCTRCGNVSETPSCEHVPETDPAVPATCTESGLTEGSHCAVCGEVLVPQEEIPPTGHTYENGVCTACGAVEEGNVSSIPSEGVELPKIIL